MEARLKRTFTSSFTASTWLEALSKAGDYTVPEEAVLRHIVEVQAIECLNGRQATVYEIEWTIE